MSSASTLNNHPFSPGVHRLWIGVGQSWHGSVPLPMIIVQGVQPGPRVVAVAAQHGDEGYAVLGIHHLAEEINPATLQGSLWMLPCLNVHGFTHGMRYSPFDHQDMNTVYPGSDEGNFTEQVAHTLIQHILPGADLLLDLHGGSPENGDVAFAKWSDVEGKPPLEPLVRCLPISFIIPTARDTPGMLGHAAAAVGVPTIAVEACNAYGRSSDNAREVADIVRTALGVLKMLPGAETQPRELPRCVAVTHRASTGGIWESYVTFGEFVNQNSILGIIRNLVGERIQVVIARAAGTVAVMRTGTRVHAGETVCTLAVAEGS
jgi:uncharacterized protein